MSWVVGKKVSKVKEKNNFERKKLKINTELRSRVKKIFMMFYYLWERFFPKLKAMPIQR